MRGVKSDVEWMGEEKEKDRTFQEEISSKEEERKEKSQMAE